MFAGPDDSESFSFVWLYRCSVSVSARLPYVRICSSFLFATICERMAAKPTGLASREIFVSVTGRNKL